MTDTPQSRRAATLVDRAKTAVPRLPWSRAAKRARRLNLAERTRAAG